MPRQQEELEKAHLAAARLHTSLQHKQSLASIQDLCHLTTQASKAGTLTLSQNTKQIKSKYASCDVQPWYTYVYVHSHGNLQILTSIRVIVRGSLNHAVIVWTGAAILLICTSQHV